MEGESAQIFHFKKPEIGEKPILRRDLDGIILENFENVGGTNYMLFGSLPNEDIATSLIEYMMTSLFHYLALPTINNFVYVPGEDNIDYNVVSIIRQIFPNYTQQYILRTHFDDDGAPITTLYNEFEGLCTFHAGNLESYLDVLDGEALKYIKRVNVPKYDFEDYPNRLRIIGERETLGLEINFADTDFFQQEHFNTLVGSYHQFCTEFLEESYDLED